jgi:hypothetical protein
MVPTISVPPPPWPVMETPLVTPVGLSDVGMAPLMTCWAKLADVQANAAANSAVLKIVTRIRKPPKISDLPAVAGSHANLVLLSFSQ